MLTFSNSLFEIAQKKEMALNLEPKISRDFQITNL